MKTLENKIREALPRLGVPTKGCVINESGTDKEIVLRYKWDYADTYSKASGRESFDFRKTSFIIVGHPIKLNDVLQYLTFLSFPVGSYQYKQVLLLWWLDSVFLADQSEELITFLNSL